jgi:hypothetical protein
MAKVYFVRHQKAGIVTSHAFRSPPTEAQQAPIKAECERMHGREGWVMIHEAEFITDESTLPVFPERPGTVATGDNTGTAGVAGPAVSAVGTVTPKAK